jgi:hypothetical protein
MSAADALVGSAAKAIGSKAGAALGERVFTPKPAFPETMVPPLSAYAAPGQPVQQGQPAQAPQGFAGVSAPAQEPRQAIRQSATEAIPWVVPAAIAGALYLGFVAVKKTLDSPPSRRGRDADDCIRRNGKTYCPVD